MHIRLSQQHFIEEEIIVHMTMMTVLTSLCSEVHKASIMFCNIIYVYRAHGRVFCKCVLCMVLLLDFDVHWEQHC